MNTLHSQFETNCGFFDLPIIIIEDNFSELGDTVENEDDKLFTSFEKTQPKKAQKTKLTIDCKAYDQNNSAKRGWEAMSNENLQELDEFEQLEKKVKKEPVTPTKDILNMKVKIADLLETHNQSSENSLVKTKSLCSPRLSESTETEYCDKQLISGTQQGITSKESKIIRIFSDERDKLLFEIHQELTEGPIVVKNLTRKELLKQDPMLLVRFYEKNLQFKNSSYFSGENLNYL